MVKIELTEAEIGTVVSSLGYARAYLWAVKGTDAREEVHTTSELLEKLSSRKDEVHTSIGETIDIQRELDWLDAQRSDEVLIDQD